MKKSMTQAHAQLALRHPVPAASDRSKQLEDWVLVWRELIVAYRVDEWTGPYKVFHFDDTRHIIYISEVESSPLVHSAWHKGNAT